MSIRFETFKLGRDFNIASFPASSLSGLWFWEHAMFCYVFVFEKRPSNKVKGDVFDQGEN